MKFFTQIALLLIAGQCTMNNAFSLNNQNRAAPPTSTSESSSRRSFLKTLTTATIATTASGINSPLSPTPYASAAVNDENIDFNSLGFKVGGKLRLGDESIMSPKAHGTSDVPVQESLRYGVSNKLADRITNYNRRFAELGVSFFVLFLSLCCCILFPIEKNGLVVGLLFCI